MSGDGPKTQAYPALSAPRGSGSLARRDASTASREHQIAEIAARQHGLVALEQLRGVGLSAVACFERVKVGRLHRIHRAVFAVGHAAMTPERRWMAAALACGPDAVLSHRSAAALWGMLPSRSSQVDVTAPGRRGRVTNGIAAHRDGSLGGRDRTLVRGIPCTTVARTLLDVAAVASRQELRSAIGEAEFLKVLDRPALQELLSRNPGRRGVARLRTCLLELDPRSPRTRNEMERRFFALCKRGGLPAPQVNSLLELRGRLVEPDFLWREARLIVETDGRQAHGTATSFERDRRRDQQLMLDGWRVARFTWRQVLDEPAEVARIVRALLAQAMGQEVRT